MSCHKVPHHQWTRFHPGGLRHQFGRWFGLVGEQWLPDSEQFYLTREAKLDRGKYNLGRQHGELTNRVSDGQRRSSATTEEHIRLGFFFLARLFRPLINYEHDSIYGLVIVLAMSRLYCCIIQTRVRPRSASAKDHYWLEIACDIMKALHIDNYSIETIERMLSRSLNIYSGQIIWNASPAMGQLLFHS